ncbi:unnamed protein product [Amaranthus hypochondriacus]
MESEKENQKNGENQITQTNQNFVHPYHLNFEAPALPSKENFDAQHLWCGPYLEASQVGWSKEESTTTVFVQHLAQCGGSDSCSHRRKTDFNIFHYPWNIFGINRRLCCEALPLTVIVVKNLGWLAVEDSSNGKALGESL